MKASDDLIPDFDDFERYYSGRMSSDEQRMLEGRMLAEPFVAQAYEGFLAWRGRYGNVSAIRTDLKGRLEARLTQAHRKTLPLWLYVSAASVLLLATGYWIVFLGGQKSAMTKQSGLVKKETSVSPAPGQLPVAIQAEPVAPAPRVSSAPHARRQAGQDSLGPSRQTSLPPAAYKTPEAAALADSQVRHEATDIALTDLLSTNAEEIQVPAQPADALAKPASVQAVGKSLTARVRTRPSSLYNVSKQNQQQPTQSGAQPLLADPDAVSRKQSVSHSIPPDAPKPSPVVGWPAYQAYLDQNTRSADTTTQVTVIFVVNSLGTMSGFTASGPLKFHQEAIRIVREGPAWVPSRAAGTAVTSLTQVQLQFRRTP